MKHHVISLGLLAIAAPAFGCMAASGDSPADEHLGATAQAQLDGGNKVYNLQQAGNLLGSAWAGATPGDPATEYWAAKAAYDHTAARSFTESSQSCADWKSSVCGTREWADATYYKATFVETTLNCAFPPGPCSPGAGSTTFLGAGSYHVLDSSSSAFAWTYVDSSCEYWAMDHTISTGTNSQSRISPLFTSLSNFETDMCALGTVPTTFYTVYYTPIRDFCSVSTC